MVDPITTVPRAATGTPPVITPVRGARPVVDDDVRYARMPRSRNPLWLGLVVAVGVAFAAHVVVNLRTPYGLHRDELLYLSMGRHLAVWRMDFPPAIAMIAELQRALLGDSLVAIRMASAVASAALVGLAYGMARLFGGRARAAMLAALAMLASPLFLRAGSLFQPVVFDQLWWTLGFLALWRVCETPGPARRIAARTHRREPRRLPAEAKGWIGLGVACGLGLLTKFSIAFFVAAVLVGIVATPLRRALRTPWPWIGVAIALAIGSPSLVGQLRLGWPVVGQLGELRDTQLERAGPIEFVIGQLLLGPAVALAGLGLWHLLRDPGTERWRAIGWTAAAAFALLLVTSGKAYYVGPIYPTLFAAGAVAFERRVLRLPRPRARTLARVAAHGAIALYGLVTLPFGLPVLAPETMARYAAALGGVGTETNTGERLALPQDYADMLGWAEQAARVDALLETLPEMQRRETVLLAANYGQAGALDFYGPRLGLPAVVSAAGSWWFFGPGDNPGATLVTVGVPVDRLRAECSRVRQAPPATHQHARWVVPEERDVVIALCEDPRQTLQDLWPSMKPR